MAVAAINPSTTSGGRSPLGPGINTRGRRAAHVTGPHRLLAPPQCADWNAATAWAVPTPNSRCTRSASGKALRLHPSPGYLFV